MKTLFSTVLIAVVALGFLLAVSPTNADAWHRSGPAVGFSLVVPPFGFSIGVPGPYYYPGPVYGAPPYPVYYHSPYYGRPYYGHRHWEHRGWRGDWHGNRHGRWHGRY
jgi:hypothetical protein